MMGRSARQEVGMSDNIPLFTKILNTLTILKIIFCGLKENKEMNLVNVIRMIKFC